MIRSLLSSLKLFPPSPRNAVRLLFSLAAWLAASLLLSACGEQVTPAVTPEPSFTTAPSRTPAPTPTPTAPTVTPSITPLPPIEEEITWCLRGSPPAALPEVSARLNALLEQRGFNAQVELRLFDPLSYDRLLEEAQASADPCDLFSVPGSRYAGWVERGGLLALAGSDMPEGGIETRFPVLWNSLPPAVWDALRLDGVLYSVPNQRAWARARGISVRADVVQALGLQPELERLDGFSDLPPLFEQLSVAINEGTLEALGVEDADQVRWVAGADGLLQPENAGYEWLAAPFVIRPDGARPAIENWYATSAFRELAELRMSWQAAGYLPPGALTPDELEAGYRAGWFLVEVGHQVWPGSAQEQQNRYGYEWIDVALTPPVIDRGSVLSSLTGVHSGLAKDAERESRTLTFLQWLHSDPEIYNLLLYGVEDRHWRRADPAQDRVTLLPASAYRPDFADQLGNHTLAYALDSQPAGFWESVRQWNVSAVVSPVLGFAFDPRPVAAEVAAVQGRLRELEAPITQSRQVDLDRAVEHLIAGLEQTGLEAFRAELDRQLEEWQASRPTR